MKHQVKVRQLTHRKINSYSRTQSLNTRISITGALNNVGYNKLWKGIYEGVELTVDENLNNHIDGIPIP